MNNKRPRLKTTPPTDESNIPTADASLQPLELKTEQTATPLIDESVQDAQLSPVSVDPPLVDEQTLTENTSSAPVSEDHSPVDEPEPAQNISSAASPEPQPFFQAIGIVIGDVTFDAEKAFVCIGGRTYSLFYCSPHKRAFEALKKEIETTGITLHRLIVYPKVTHYPGGKQPYSLAFQLVGFVGHQVSGTGVSSTLEDMEFKLCGLWQFIPVCRIPCISIFKNFNQQRLEFIKSAQLDKKVNFMKASHIPVFWRDAPVPPFRFNPKLEKEAQGKASFVQIKARFNSERNTFEFVSLLALPSSEPPNYLKAGKKDKLEVAKTKLAAAKARKRESFPVPNNEAGQTTSRSSSTPKPKPTPKVRTEQ